MNTLTEKEWLGKHLALASELHTSFGLIPEAAHEAAQMALERIVGPMPDDDQKQAAGGPETYEVFIDVTHYPKHCEGFAEKLSDAAKLSFDADQGPQAVAYALRALADRVHPETLESENGALIALQASGELGTLGAQIVLDRLERDGYVIVKKEASS